MVCFIVVLAVCRGIRVAAPHVFFGFFFSKFRHPEGLWEMETLTEGWAGAASIQVGVAGVFGLICYATYDLASALATVASIVVVTMPLSFAIFALGSSFEDNSPVRMHARAIDAVHCGVAPPCRTRRAVGAAWLGARHATRSAAQSANRLR